MKKLVLCLSVLLVAGEAVLFAGAPIPADKPATYPSWWFSREVIKQIPPGSNTPTWGANYVHADDFAAVNAGQLKNVATNAYCEFQARLPGGIGDTQAPNGTGYLLRQMVEGWQNSTVNADDYAAINLGQLKAVGALFYRRLQEVGYGNGLPWSNGSTDDYAVANVGQLKNVFSFDLGTDSDGNGIPDWWELKYFGVTGQVLTALAPRGDGKTIQDCYNLGLNPIDFYNGQQVVMEVVSGDNQSANPGTFFTQPIIVAVIKADGNPWPNAPVTFSAASSLGGFAAASGQMVAPTMSVMTDASGQAKAYFKPVASVTGLGAATASVQQVQFTVSGADSGVAPAVAPTLQTNSNTPGTTVLTWNTGSTNSTGAIVQKWTFATGWVTISGAGVAGNSYVDTYTPDGNVVAYRVATTNSHGQSGFSIVQSSDGSDLTKRDSDGDGLMDAEEIAIGSNPNNRDTDGDGVPDGQDLDPLDSDIKLPRVSKTSYAIINLTGLGLTGGVVNDKLQVLDAQYLNANQPTLRLWTNGQFKSIGTPPVPSGATSFSYDYFGLGNSGQVAFNVTANISGGYGSQSKAAYVWDPLTDSFKFLPSCFPDLDAGTDPTAATQSQVSCISSSGVIAGACIGNRGDFVLGQEFHRAGAVWGLDYGVSAVVADDIVTTYKSGILQSVTGENSFTSYAVNDNKVAAGSVKNRLTDQWRSPAALWTPGQGVVRLTNTLDGQHDEATAVNNLNPPVAAGKYTTADFNNFPAAMWMLVNDIWKQKDLGPWIPSQQQHTAVIGNIDQINDRCEMIGWFDQLGGNYQSLGNFWQNGQIIDLDTLVAGSGYSELYPVSLNNYGAMTAGAKDDLHNGQNVFLLLVPVNVTLQQTELSSTSTLVTATVTTPGGAGSSSVPVGDGSIISWSILSAPGTLPSGTLSGATGATFGGHTTVIVSHPEGAPVMIAGTLTNLSAAQLTSAAFGPSASTVVQSNADENPADPTPQKGTQINIAELDDVSGPAYRRVALNGRAIPERIAGQKVETESEAEESYIDAFTLRLHHSVTDLYVPIENSELSLSVRRNLDSETWNERSGLRPAERQDRPFGAEWSSNLTPNIHFVYQQPNTIDVNAEADYAYVTDEEGNQMRFVILGGAKSSLGPGQYFVPLPSSKLEQANFLSTLTDNGNGNYTLRKERGTVLQFHLVAGLDKTIGMDRLTGVQGQVLHRYAGIGTVTDRMGYWLQYTLADGLVPSTITASTGQSITMTTDGAGHVLTARDPMGKTVTYEYAAVQALDGNGDEGKELKSVIHPADLHGNSPIERYAYDGITEPDLRLVTATPTPWYHLDLKSVTDARLNTHTFNYTFDHSRQQYDASNGYYAASGSPRNLSSVILPGNTGTARFENHSRFRATFAGFQVPNVQFDGYRSTYIVDAAGHSRLYQFLDNQVVLLNNFKPYANNNVNPLGLPRQVAFKTMQVTSFADATVSIVENAANYTMGIGGGAVLGTETVTYDLGAGLAVASYTDINGHKTTYSHSDVWNVAAAYPWLNTYYPYGRYPEPTERIDALNQKKTFTYDGTWRLMTSVTDELLRKTQYTLDAQGRRTEEKVFDPVAGLIQDTTWAYGSADFPGFVTFHTVENLNGNTLPWATDLVTRFVPDIHGRVLSQTVDPNGHPLTTVFGYDDNGNKTSAKDPKGFTTNFDYDDLNRLTKVTYPLVTGGAARAYKSFDYDLNSNKIVETDEKGHQSLFTYDALNRLTKQARDMNGNGQMDPGVDLITSYGYNAVNSRLTVTDPNGNTTTTAYDGFERPLTVTQPPPTPGAASYVTHFAYVGNAGPGVLEGGAFKPTSSTDDRGYVTAMTYDELYRLKNKTVTYDQNGSVSTTVLNYDSVGNQVYEKDPRGNETTFVYDGLNRLVETDLADELNRPIKRQIKYSSTGLKSATIDENTNETDYTYDGAGRLVTVTGPAVDDGTGTNTTQRPVSTNHYDDNGNLTFVVDPRQKTTSFEYDERNRKTKEIHPAVVDPVTLLLEHPTILTSYDDAGNVKSVKDARQNETITDYDAANRPWQVTYPAALLFDGTSPQTTHRTTYDNNGNALTVTDQNGHTTVNTYDALNRLWTTTQMPTDVDSIQVTYGYDAANNRTSVQDGKNQTTTFTYDGLNRNTSIKDPANKGATYQYDGLVKTGRLDALGHQTIYDYDVRNRLKTVTYVGRESDDRTYNYDDVGNLLSVTEPPQNGQPNLANVGYTYDALNRVKTETSHGVQHTYSYDLDGNRTRVLYGGTNRLLISSFDDDNRLSSIVDGASTTGYVYDLNGNLVSQTLPNGDATTTVFDALNRKQSIDTKSGANVALQHFDYGYDGGGNVRTITETYGTANAGLNRVVANIYDKIDRLTTETVTGNGASSTVYVYDAANNRTSKTVTGGANPGPTTYVFANALNQIQSYTDPSGSTVTFGYDDDGNRTSSTAGNAVYTYDFENRLVGLTQNGTTYSYVYDYRSRRIQRAEGNTTTDLVFSGGTSAQEYVGSTQNVANLTVEYLRGSDWGGGVGGLLYSLRGGVPSFTHYDGRGDVTEKTSSTGAVTYQATYEAYGTRPAENGATQDRQKANTKEEDPSGLLNEGMRYRDLVAGVFITRDPAGFIDGPNLYCYVNQNPWTKFDPDGLEVAAVARPPVWVSPSDPDMIAARALIRRMAIRRIAAGAGAVAAAGVIGWEVGNQIDKIPAVRSNTTDYFYNAFFWDAETVRAHVMSSSSGQRHQEFERGLVMPLETEADIEAHRNFLMTGDRRALDNYLANRSTGPGGGSASVRNARSAIDVDEIVARNGGRKLEAGGYLFPNRRAALQAASEVAGDLGSNPVPIRRSEYLDDKNKWFEKTSDRVIGKKSQDGGRLYRDDEIGHRFDRRPHVNVMNKPGGVENEHFYYPTTRELPPQDRP